jgi:Zn-dependent protease
LEPIDIVNAVLWYAAFVISTTAHEASHALAAYAGGDPTAYRAGQVTLNPLPHMRREPFGMVVAPLVFLVAQGWCLGWASTPYDPAWERRHPRRAAWMSAAGPGANLAIAVVALLVLRVGLEVELFYPPERIGFSQLIGASSPFLGTLGSFLSILLVLNVILALFNMIPFPPLDGATVITLLLPEDFGLRFRAIVAGTPVGWVGLIAAWFLFGEIVGPVWSALVALVHPEVAYR